MNQARIFVFFFAVCLSFKASAFNCTWQFSDFTMTPESVKRVTIVPLWPYAVNGNNIILPDKIVRNTDSNSTVTVSNMVAGFAYSVTFSGNSVVSSFTNYFSTNVVGNVNGKDYIPISTNLYGGQVAYSQSASDARYDPIQSALNTSNAIISLANSGAWTLNLQSAYGYPYSSLLGSPTNVSQFNNNSGYQTALQVTNIAQSFNNTNAITNNPTYAITTQSPSQSAPATNEFVTAGYINSILAFAQTYYGTTNSAGINTKGTPSYFMSNTNPATSYTRTYTGVSNGQYLTALVVTNVAAFSGPFVITKNIFVTNSGPNPTLSIAYEVYYSTNSNLMNLTDPQWSSGAIPLICDGSTNTYTATVAVPFMQLPTNGYVVIFSKLSNVYRISSVSLQGGNGTKSIVSFNNSYGALSSVYQPYSTNLTQWSLVSTSSIPSTNGFIQLADATNVSASFVAPINSVTNSFLTTNKVGSAAFASASSFDASGAANTAMTTSTNFTLNQGYQTAPQVAAIIGGSNLVTQATLTTASNGAVTSANSFTTGQGYQTAANVAALIGGSNLVTQPQLSAVSNTLVGLFPATNTFTITNDTRQLVLSNANSYFMGKTGNFTNINTRLFTNTTGAYFNGPTTFTGNDTHNGTSVYNGAVQFNNPSGTAVFGNASGGAHLLIDATGGNITGVDEAGIGAGAVPYISNIGTISTTTDGGTASGNITAAGQFVGNGAGLTNLPIAPSVVTNNYASPFVVTNNNSTPVAIYGNTTAFYQLWIQNLNPLGSSDIVWGNDLSSPLGNWYYGNAGINGSQYSGPWGGPSDVYLFSQASNLWLGASGTNSSVNFSVGNGGTLTNAWLNTNGLYVWEGYRNSTAPFDATEFLTSGAFQLTNLPAGQLVYNGGYMWSGTNLTPYATITALNTLGQNDTNFSLTIGANDTNFAKLVTNGLLSSVSYSNRLYVVGGTYITNVVNSAGVWDDDSTFLLTNDDRTLFFGTVNATNVTATNGTFATLNVSNVVGNLVSSLSVSNANATNVFAANFIANQFITIASNIQPQNLAVVLTNAFVAGLIRSNQVVMMQTNYPSSPGELAFFSVKADTNNQLANIRCGTISAALSGQWNGGVLAGNITGSASTTGTIAVTNGTFTNAIVQRALYIGTTNMSGIPLAYTNGPQLSNCVVLYSTGASGSTPNLYVGAFNAGSSNLFTANLTVGVAAASQFATYNTAGISFTGTNANFTNVAATTYYIQTNLNAMATNGYIVSFQMTNAPFLWATNDATGLTIYDTYWNSSQITPANHNMGNLVATNSKIGNSTYGSNAVVVGTITGNGSGLTNVPAAGVLNGISTWTGPTNYLNLTNSSDWFYVAAANCAITNTYGAALGTNYAVSLTISNSTGGAITSYWTAPGYAVGAATTNAVTVPAGKEVYWSIWCRNGNRTNYMNCLQQ